MPTAIPITTVTDANGYYEFNMLYPGVYSIVECSPSQYLPGVDTAGSKGGLVVNRYAASRSASSSARWRLILKAARS